MIARMYKLYLNNEGLNYLKKLGVWKSYKNYNLRYSKKKLLNSMRRYITVGIENRKKKNDE